MLSAFREALQQRGWTEGKNLSIDVRWPKVSFTQEPGLISEVLHSNVDVIVAWATPTALAVRRATSTIPIVLLGISDPVGSGLAASLAHPGGNATGSSNLAPDLSAKLVGTFAQLVPGMSSVGVVVNPANPGAVAQMDGTQQAVHALGLRSQVVNAGTLEEYERAFARFKIEGVHGVVLLQDPSSAEANAHYMTALRKGLSETGTVEDQNVTVEYHWLEGLLFLTQRPVPRLLTLAMTRKKFGP